MTTLKEPAVFAEILPNVRSMSINIGIPEEKTKSIYKIEIRPLKIIVEEQKTSIPLQTVLNCSQTIETSEQPSITTSSESLDIKVKLRSYVRKKPAKQSTENDIIPPFSAAEVAKLKNIKCSSCKTNLLKPKVFDKIMDMPSEHWLELLDCWMCHKENYQQAHIGDITAKEKTCLVGNTYFLVHNADVKSGAVKIEDGVTQLDWARELSRKWRPMSCSRCLSPIGEGLYSTFDEPDTIPLAIKFNKYLTIIELEENKESLECGSSSVHMCRFTAIIATDFLEAAKAHATYRFIIEGRKSNTPLILIWLFDWNTKIMFNALQDVSPWHRFSQCVTQNFNFLEDLKPNGVIKLLYIDCTSVKNNNSNDDKSSRLIDQWSKDKTVEHLRYHDDICLELLLILK
ncbi:3106_t:CDS:2, partial [Acaulospora morrowiae]